jgi:hypothetical protein
MSIITKNIFVAASPIDIMNYISDVRNHPAFIPPLKSIDAVEGDEKQEGTDWDWVFEMGGIELHGKSHTLEYKEGELFRYKTTGGIISEFTYATNPEGEGTNLSITVEYEVPETVLGNIADASVVEKLNEAQADAAAENIKAILEG